MYCEKLEISSEFHQETLITIKRNIIDVDNHKKCTCPLSQCLSAFTQSFYHLRWERLYSS